MRQTERDIAQVEETGPFEWRPALFEAFQWYPASTTSGERVLVLFASDRLVVETQSGDGPSLEDHAAQHFIGVSIARTPGGYLLTIEHAERERSLTLAQTFLFEDAQRFRDRLAAHLTRPFLGEIRMAARVQGGQSIDTRRRRLRNPLRPRFLVRRKAGLVRAAPPLAASEIIARS
ncbi:hypothetical protein [Afifella sp. IM 167]|uniref:hypothetical protein n=1 Tax=Afifella sp. IM 167 TaxID=2033586 RepID=UPI001CCCF8D6|nr:hypothetical protein [Afifella sp. IM 167]MBZ8133468.1 hypothetical protein [Afifella sp. IM 167]